MSKQVSRSFFDKLFVAKFANLQIGIDVEMKSLAFLLMSFKFDLPHGNIFREISLAISANSIHAFNTILLFLVALKSISCLEILITNFANMIGYNVFFIVTTLFCMFSRLVK